MSGNVAIARAALKAIRRRDREAAAKLIHPAAEWRNTDLFPGPRTCRGPDEIIAFWEGLLDVFEEEDATDVVQAAGGEDRVALAIRTHGRGAASGAPVDTDWALVLWLREDRVVRFDVHGSYAKALTAAGLADES